MDQHVSIIIFECVSEQQGETLKTLHNNRYPISDHTN